MQFERIKWLIEETKYQNLIKHKILIVGIGGVGGYALEMLVRTGFTDITIIDHDKIELTNLNRQIITTHNNIGFFKADEALIRAKKINNNCNIKVIKEFLQEENITIIDNSYDYIIDACDTITTKLLLIKRAQKLNLKLITCLGTGNRLDPTKLEITKLNKTYNDPVAKILRKLLKENNLKEKIAVIWSKEVPYKIKKRTPGSLPLVPSTAGIYCASYIINDILKSEN